MKGARFGRARGAGAAAWLLLAPVGGAQVVLDVGDPEVLPRLQWAGHDLSLELPYAPEHLAWSADGGVVAGGACAVLVDEDRPHDFSLWLFLARDGELVWQRTVDLEPSLSSAIDVLPDLRDVFVLRGGAALWCLRTGDDEEEWRYAPPRGEQVVRTIEEAGRTWRRWLVEDGASVVVEAGGKAHRLCVRSAFPPFELSSTLDLEPDSRVFDGPEGLEVHAGDGRRLRFEQASHLTDVDGGEAPITALEATFDVETSFPVSGGPYDARWILDADGGVVELQRGGGGGPAVIVVDLPLSSTPRPVAGAEIAAFSNGAETVVLDRTSSSVSRLPLEADRLSAGADVVLGMRHDGEAFLVTNRARVLWERRVVFEGDTATLGHSCGGIRARCSGVAPGGEAFALVFGGDGRSDVLLLLDSAGLPSATVDLPFGFVSRSVAVRGESVLISGRDSSLLLSRTGVPPVRLPALGQVVGTELGFASFEERSGRLRHLRPRGGG